MRIRLERFASYVFAELPSALQQGCAESYCRGLMEEGRRKSLEPLVARQGGDSADYQRQQRFLADCPWESDSVYRRLERRLLRRFEPEAVIIDETSIPKAGRHSPGVAPQYCGALGKTANCQVVVTANVAGRLGSLLLGARLYLPKAWISDAERRARAKIPADVEFQTKPALALALLRRLGPKARALPALGDCNYGDSRQLRDALAADERHYLFAVSPTATAFPAQTRFTRPKARRASERRARRLKPSRKPQALAQLAADLIPELQELPVGVKPYSSFAFRRIHVGYFDHRRCRLRSAQEPREEWLIVERRGGEERLRYYLSNLPAATPAERLAHLARLRWRVELDYRELKSQLGLAHYEGRSFAGLHHHFALAAAAHAFLVEERLDPKSPARELTLPQAVAMLQSLLRCWDGRCRTCQRPITIEDVPLQRRRE